METWKEFEIESTEYLNKFFGGYAVFTQEGMEDSTKSDIHVKTQKGKSFYIEAKHAPAQSGQFVLTPNIETRKFDYSKKNVNVFNKYAQCIMEQMDKSFEEYKDAGTSGKDISFSNDQEVFSYWIEDMYRKKGAKYVITNNFTILPVEKFGDCFDITAKYRVKRSGSTSVGKSNIAAVEKILKDNYSVKDMRVDGDKVFISSDVNLHDQRFYYGKYEYMISKRDSEYEIRRLSNTFNANVIFSISRKNGFVGLTKDEFIKALEE